MLPQQDGEDDPVDLVVETVEGDHLDFGLRLEVAVDAALALLVARRVPRQVVMDDGVESFLEVDPLRQAIGRNKDPTLMLRELVHAGLALVRGQLAGHRLDGDIWAEGRAQGVLHVFGGRDEAAENDRVRPVANESAHDLDPPSELRIASTEEGVGLARQIT
jgi:hypothetical protein